MGLLTLRQSKLAYRLDFALYGAGIVLLGAVLVISASTHWLVDALFAIAGLLG